MPRKTATVIPPEDLSPVEGRSFTNPWFKDQALVGATLYDTPDGGPLDSTDVDIEFDEEMRPRPGEQFLPPGFSGEVLATGFATLRYLPEDTYVPVPHVRACLLAALWWDKGVDVSWMQMDFDPLRGCEVPVQHHRKAAALVFYDDDPASASFGIVAAGDESHQSIRLDLVTDIHLENLVPTPARIVSWHDQRDGSRVRYEHVSDDDMADDGWARLSKDVHVLDDGTKVPIFVNVEGQRFSPIVQMASDEQALQAQFDSHAGLDDYLWYGTESEIQWIDHLRESGDPKWRDEAEAVIRAGRAQFAAEVERRGIQVDG